MNTENMITFDEHKFIKKVKSDCINYFNSEPNSKYCKSVQTELNKIEKSLKGLQYIRILIAELHSKVSEPSESKISHQWLLKYHIENYFLRIATYKDHIIYLISKVYCWPISGQNGDENKIKIKAKNDGKIEVAFIIEKVKTLLSKVSITRNIIAHQGSLSDPDLYLIQENDFFKELFKSAGIIDNISDDQFETYYGAVIMKNLKEILYNEEQLATNFFEILDLIYDRYNSQIL